MNFSLDYIESEPYSSAAYDAVRYGYQYRKEAERYANSVGGKLHHCLPEPSAVLVFLAKAIIGGIAYDLFKAFAKKIWIEIKNHKSIKEDKEVCDLFSSEESLEQFYLHITEFHNKEMNITSLQEKYIKEEVIADYYGEKTDIIFQQTNRFPTTQDNIVISQEAYQRAESIIVRKKINHRGDS